MLPAYIPAALEGMRARDYKLFVTMSTPSAHKSHPSRSLLVSWLIEAGFNDACNTVCSRETLHTSVQYIDRALAVSRPSPTQLPTLAAAALFLASKYEESTIIDIPNILKAMPPAEGSTKHTAKGILNYERDLFTQLGFNADTITAAHWAPVAADAAGIPLAGLALDLVNCILDLSLLDPTMTSDYPPSQIASAAVRWASSILHPEHPAAAAAHAEPATPASAHRKRQRDTADALRKPLPRAASTQARLVEAGGGCCGRRGVCGGGCASLLAASLGLQRRQPRQPAPGLRALVSRLPARLPLPRTCNSGRQSRAGDRDAVPAQVETPALAAAAPQPLCLLGIDATAATFSGAHDAAHIGTPRAAVLPPSPSMPLLLSPTTSPRGGSSVLAEPSAAESSLINAVPDAEGFLPKDGSTDMMPLVGGVIDSGRSLSAFQSSSTVAETGDAFDHWPLRDSVDMGYSAVELQPVVERLRWLWGVLRESQLRTLFSCYQHRHNVTALVDDSLGLDPVPIIPPGSRVRF